MRAGILVRVSPGSEPDVTEAIEALSPVEDAFAVIGQPEIVVRVRVPSVEALAGVVSRISEIDGVVVSETLLEIPQGAIG